MKNNELDILVSLILISGSELKMFEPSHENCSYI